MRLYNNLLNPEKQPDDDYICMHQRNVIKKTSRYSKSNKNGCIEF